MSKINTEMDDKTLLELAAKVAGVEYPKWRRWSGGYPDLWPRWRWNPLIDDGDAFRLAVKLKLVVHVNESYTIVDSGVLRNTVAETHNGRPEFATRRAIVIAAAKMAKLEIER